MARVRIHGLVSATGLVGAMLLLLSPALAAPTLGTAAGAAANAVAAEVGGVLPGAGVIKKKPDNDKPSVAFAAPLPKEIKLNDRKGKVGLEFGGVDGVADVHVDIMGNTWPYWFGGGMTQVEGPQGAVKVPLEVRIPSYYSGPLTLRAYMSKPKGQFEDRIAEAKDLPVNLSKVPVDSIGVLCSPIQVTPSKAFTLNLWYTQTHPRESDIIAVALHADTKEYYGGYTIPINQMMGHVSGVFPLKEGPPNAPLKFKAWISPRGEAAPNYVSYTMINTAVGPNVIQDCNPTVKNEWTPGDLPPADWVEIHGAPAQFASGSVVPLTLEYQLASSKEGTLVVALMDWDWATHGSNLIASSSSLILARQNEVAVKIQVPADAKPARDGVYWIAYFTPVDGTYDDAYAEDRVYNSKLTPTSTDPAVTTKETEVTPVGGLRGGNKA